MTISTHPKKIEEILTRGVEQVYPSKEFLEKGCQIGEKQISHETVKTVLSPDLDSLEPSLARHGYNVPILCEYLGATRNEVRAYLRGQLVSNRLEEFNKEIHKLGVVV